MVLSKDLISQFVKITNDTQKKTTETTVYGTIDDTGTNVKLDGSPDGVLTPISSTTNVKPGDRVTVMIKNHTATVTGNLTSPAPRRDDVADVGAVTAKISELELFISNLKIGGRNLLLKTATTKSVTGTNITNECTILYDVVDHFDSLNGETLTISCVYTISNYSSGTFEFQFAYDSWQSPGTITPTGNGTFVFTKRFTRFSEASDVCLRVRLDNFIGSITFSQMKLEVGDKATDWTPAPEDVQEDIDNAAKTATNYLGFSSSGLVVGDMTAGSLGKNVLIDSDSVDIRNGTTRMASFGANELILGQNAANSVINLCDGAGKISAITSGATTSYPHYDGIKMESEEIEFESSSFQGTFSNGTSFINTSKIGTTNQSSAAGSVSNFKSECKIASSGSRLSTGLLASASSSASTTCTDIFASHYNASSGTTNSNYVSVYPTHTQMSKPITINGVYITAKNKHLWSGANYMNASQSITLSEAVSAQVNGIVLVWSYYENGAAKDHNFHCHFVPKWLVSTYAGKGSDYPLANHTGNVLAHKYLYISDTKITGNDYNDDSNLAGSQVTYKNTFFVLRAVIGV